jgi:hypothetical protein
MADVGNAHKIFVKQTNEKRPLEKGQDVNVILKLGFK